MVVLPVSPLIRCYSRRNAFDCTPLGRRATGARVPPNGPKFLAIKQTGFIETLLNLVGIFLLFLFPNDLSDHHCLYLKAIGLSEILNSARMRATQPQIRSDLVVFVSLHLVHISCMLFEVVFILGLSKGSYIDAFTFKGA